MAQFFNAPPAAEALTNAQLLYSYLYKMSEQLNYAYSSLEKSNAVTESGQRVTVSYPTPDGGSQTVEYDSETYKELKALILKTGNAVNSSMAALKTDLELTMQTDYVASSVFGDYKEQIASEMNVAADGIQTIYSFQSELNAAQEELAGFSQWRTDSQQYIRTGLLYFDDDNNPKVGVAIGDLQTVQSVDGQPITESNNLMATFVSDRLTFWQNGKRLAYFSNSTVFAENMEVIGKLKIDHFIAEATARGLEIKWEDS